MKYESKKQIVYLASAFCTIVWGLVLYKMVGPVSGLYSPFMNPNTFYIACTGMFAYAIIGGYGLSLIPGMTLDILDEFYDDD